MPLTPQNPKMATSTSRACGARVEPAVIVVGYDGTEPARRALDWATRFAEATGGRMEVVFVSHVPAGAILSPQAIVLFEQSQEALAQQLTAEVRQRLMKQTLPWYFQHRAGPVAAELLAAASDLRRRFEGAAEVVVVLGGSAHKFHRVAGSVGAAVVRHDRFPIVVVP
jgi:nucleotide-binding universal stress UspA family protein